METIHISSQPRGKKKLLKSGAIFNIKKFWIKIWQTWSAKIPLSPKIVACLDQRTISRKVWTLFNLE